MPQADMNVGTLGLIFMLPLLLLVFILVSTSKKTSGDDIETSRLTDHGSSPHSPTGATQRGRYFSAILTIMKNESMVIEEFLRHHLIQVDHIFLIDNGSTDRTLFKVAPWVRQKRVSVISLPQPHAQTQHYNQVYAQIRHRVTWLAVIDVDEYLFGVQQPLKDWLKSPENQADYYSCKWTMFGSSGHVKQPASIRSALVWRQPTSHLNGKSVFKTEMVETLHIHDHTTLPQTKKVYVDIQDSRLRLHHYQIMSQEYFEKVKLARGDAHTPDHVRNMSDFQGFDELCTEFDDTLATLPYLQ